MKTVEVPTGFDFAAVADLDIDTIGQAEIESAFRLDMPAHHRGWTAVSCRRNCRDNPGCLTFLGEDNWWWAEEEELDEEEEEEVRPLNFPAGLRNLGNTCYVNSLLQIWYHNTAFRQAVYDWDPREDCPEHEKVASLQALFAQMEFTLRRFVDPLDLVQKLGLNPAVQQDAQEFSMLFISVLEEAFSRQSKESVRTMVQTQLRGGLAYITRCEQCGQESFTQGTFYQLELSLEGNSSVQDCLEDYTKVEQMTGEERYHCHHCGGKQDATRSCRLTDLPPVLNLQLNRFHYNIKQGRKVKIFTDIEFPSELDMSPYHSDSSVYRLTALLVHLGHDANQGHYIALIKDQTPGVWFQLNDAKVFRVPEDEVLQRSENVYMLVYVRQEEPISMNLTEEEELSMDTETDSADSSDSDEHSVTYNVKTIPENFPSHLRDLVCQDQAEFQAEVEARNLQRKLEQMERVAFQRTMCQTYHFLFHRGAAASAEFLPLSWLRQWLAEPLTCGNIQTADLLCLHGQLDLERLHEVKRCRADTVARLYQEHGAGPGPRLTSQLLCRICVVNKARKVSLQTKLMEDHQFLLEDSGPVDGRGFWVARTSLRSWRRLAMTELERHIKQEEREWVRKNGLQGRRKRKTDRFLLDFQKKFQRMGSNVSINLADASDDSVADICDTANLLVTSTKEESPFDVAPQVIEEQERDQEVFNHDLYCDHGKLNTNAGDRRLVSQEAWWRLKSYFSSPVTFQLGERPCSVCAEKREAWRLEALRQRTSLENLFLDIQRPSLTQPGSRKVFLVTAAFVKAWRDFVRGSGLRVTRLDNMSLLCVHGHFKHLPALSSEHQHQVLVMVSEEEWSTIKEMFKVDAEISVERVNALNGPKLEVFPPPCFSCYDSRLGESPTYESFVTVRRVEQRETEEREIYVSSEMVLRQFKLKVSESFNVLPCNQRLLLNGEYLRSNNSTLLQLNISPGCIIFLRVKEIVIFEVDEVEENSEDLPETGFKGTGLASC